MKKRGKQELPNAGNYIEVKTKNQTHKGILLENNDDIGNIKLGVYSGCTVIGFAIQLAYYMGFKEVYLLGVDCDYSKGKYFDDMKLNRFFNAGNEKFGWNKIFKSYEVLKNVFEKDDRKIYNATKGGKLEVFDRKKLEDVL